MRTIQMSTDELKTKCGQSAIKRNKILTCEKKRMNLENMLE